MSYVAERIREARDAMSAGNFRRVVQICEQLRANEKPNDAQLAEIFALLGGAHVALGEHETALIFLKRADRTADTAAAAKHACRELGLEGDVSEFFELGDARQRLRRRARIGWVIGALISFPLLGSCCFCLFWNSVGAMGLFDLTTWAEQYEAAQQAGMEAGRSGTVVTCEQLLASELAQCTAGAEEAEAAGCLSFASSFHGCLMTTSGWDAYCLDVPPPYPHRAANEWARARCDAHAARLGLTGERADIVSRMCLASLSSIPVYCADPEMRPREHGGYDEEVFDELEP